MKFKACGSTVTCADYQKNTIGANTYLGSDYVNTQCPKITLSVGLFNYTLPTPLYADKGSFVKIWYSGVETGLIAIDTSGDTNYSDYRYNFASGGNPKNTVLNTTANWRFQIRVLTKSIKSISKRREL